MRGAGRWCAAAAMVAVPLAGCTTGGEEPASRPTGSSPTGSGTASGADNAADGGPPDLPQPLEPTLAGGVSGLIAEQYGVTRASNGHALVLWQPPNQDRAFYRVYDRTWAPVNPLLEVGVSLEVVRGLRSSFLARATLCNRDCSRLLLDEWVVISENGQLRRVARDPERHPLEPGDLRARTPFAHKWAFRPRTGSVVRIAPRPWESAAHFPYVDDRGAVCVVPPGTRSGDPVFTSLDDGLTWRRVGTGTIDSLDGNPRVQSCATAADRVIVMTGFEYPEHVSVLDRTSGTLVSRIRLGDRLGDSRFSGYGWQLLPDGRLVFDALGPGLLVASDPSNLQFVFRPGPHAPFGLTVDVVDGDLIDSVPARRSLLFSEDAGRTWSEVDLSLPPPA